MNNFLRSVIVYSGNTEYAVNNYGIRKIVVLERQVRDDVIMSILGFCNQRPWRLYFRVTSAIKWIWLTSPSLSSANSQLCTSSIVLESKRERERERKRVLNSYELFTRGITTGMWCIRISKLQMLFWYWQATAKLPSSFRALYLLRHAF